MVQTAGQYLRRPHARSMHSTSVSACAAWHQMVPVCTEWCTEANEATQTHCYDPVAPAYPIWAYYVHGWQRRCQQDPVSLPSGRLEKTTRSSSHHVAQHRPTGSETTPPYAPEAADLAQNRPLWRMMSTYGAMQSWVACQKRRSIMPFIIKYTIW